MHISAERKKGMNGAVWTWAGAETGKNTNNPQSSAQFTGRGNVVNKKENLC